MWRAVAVECVRDRAPRGMPVVAAAAATATTVLHFEYCFLCERLNKNCMVINLQLQPLHTYTQSSLWLVLAWYCWWCKAVYSAMASCGRTWANDSLHAWTPDPGKRSQAFACYSQPIAGMFFIMYAYLCLFLVGHRRFPHLLQEQPSSFCNGNE